jgi:hypothetical protein
MEKKKKITLDKLFGIWRKKKFSLSKLREKQWNRKKFIKKKNGK